MNVAKMKLSSSNTYHPPVIVAFIILLAGIAAMLGTYWDDAWHTDIGRDVFSSPPHLLLYAGVGVMLLAIAWWILQVWRAEASIWAVLRQPVLVLPLVGTLLTIASAPIDDFWHQAFGRDAVLWSPPHTAGIVGLFAVAAGLLLAVRRLPGRAGALLTTGFGALLLVTLMIPVMEYETDVPQFAVLWYLPVMTVLMLFSFTLLALVSKRRWIATEVALLYTLLRLISVAMLIVLGHSLAVVPPLLIPAIVFDFARQRRWPALVIALSVGLAVYLSYLPYHALVPGGLAFSSGDILIGLPLAFGASWLVFALLGRNVYIPRAALLIIFALTLAFMPKLVLAHDPGQGENVRPVELVASQDGAAVTVLARLLNEANCEGLEPWQITARRAGQELKAELLRSDACNFVGKITLEGKGRWFLYTEFLVTDEVAEAWLPFEVGSQERAERVTDIYIPAASSNRAGIKTVSGVLLYGLNIVVLAFTALIYRREGRSA